jgi:hypothetical protein
MSFGAQQHRAEMEQYRQTRAYYASIRRPGLEWATFVLALLASSSVCLRVFGVGFSNDNHSTQWLTAFYWGSLIVFASLDSFLSKAHHPVPTPFGSLNPARIYEKFAMQERAWQLILVLMLPLTVRLVDAIVFLRSVQQAR